MASNVLLINSNRCQSPDPVFPLGLACINAALRRAGHTTRWVDVLANGTTLPQAIADFQPDWVGISIRNIDDVLIRRKETYLEGVVSICDTIRRHSQAPILLGGSGFSLFPEAHLRHTGADFGICGEAESSVITLLEAHSTRGDLSGIPGLVYREGDTIRRNPAIAGLSTSALDLADYPTHVAEHYLRTSGMLNIQTQRGCACHCCYCTYPLIEGHRSRARDPEAVASEFEVLHRLGARHVFIVDSVFNSSPTHAARICEALVRRNNPVKWSCFLRPQGLSPELMRLMTQAGLSHIEFGSDSFCDEVLHAYGKGLTFDDILRSSEMARKEGIEFCHFLISGGPGETLATLDQGFENSRRLGDTIILAVTGMRIYPGTRVHARALAEGRIQPDTNLLAPVYYLSPHLTDKEVFDRLAEFSRRMPSWIVGDPSPAYLKLVERLRQRGVVGPLWGYFSTMQRLWPQPPSPARQ